MIDAGWKQRAKNLVRGWQRSLHAGFVRRFRSYGPDELLNALRQAGVQAGDQLMIHASFDERHGFNGTAGEAIDALIAAVGPAGSLYMVSMPYRTSTREYLQGNPVFDARRTPSRMGLISEFFRRRQGVQRSLHPTHPLLGYGPAASTTLSGHEECLYPCGPGSPFERLLRAGGKVAFLNALLDTLTYFHYLEHLVAPRLPFPLYEDELYQAGLIAASGQEVSIPTRVFSQDSIRRRRPAILQRWMRESGILVTVRPGASRLSVLDLGDVTDVVLARAAKGEFFYDMP